MHTNKEILKSGTEDYYFRYSWFQLIRPMTLSGTISPLLAGTVFAASVGPVRADRFIALFISALFIQAATNMLNDYFDFQNGQDQDKWIPCQNSIAHHGPTHRLIPYVAAAMFIVAMITGLWLVLISSFWVTIVGIVGIMVGYAYSAGKYSLSSIGLGELVAAIFMGPVITVLAYAVQGHHFNLEILAISIPFALLIASMVLTNNIRDIEKDQVFRKTLAQFLGRDKAVYLLGTLLILSYLTVILLIVFQVVPSSALLVFLALPFAARLIRFFRKDAERIDEMNGMKWAARHHWAFGLLFTIGIWLFG